MNETAIQHHSDPAQEAPTIERIVRDETLRPGSYWRAARDVHFPASSDDRYAQDYRSAYLAKAGTVLLLTDVRKNGGDDHTVVLSRHPRDLDNGNPGRPLWILVNDFYESFEICPDGEQVRGRELGEIQTRIGLVQQQIARAASDPAYMNTLVQEALVQKAANQGAESGGLPALREGAAELSILQVQAPSLRLALSPGGAVESMNQALQAVSDAKAVAEIQGEWFGGKAKEIVHLTTQMTPYLMEKSRVALVRTQKAIDHSKRLMEGVATLGLFTGTDVTCTKIVDGIPADPGTPIRLFQRRLFADEEMSFLADYAERLSVNNYYRFVEALNDSSALRDLLIPAQRGVVLLAVSRQKIYSSGEMSARELYESLGIQEANRLGFLLVRDGEQFFTIDSPIPDHQHATQLFPAQDVSGSVFRGLNGDAVTVDDLRWTKGLDRIRAQHVMYTRFAVTLAGQIAKDHFWKGVDFQSLFFGSGQSQFELVSDVTGEGLLSNQSESLHEWMKRHQGAAQPGVRMILDLTHFISEASTPAAFKEVRQRTRHGTEMVMQRQVEIKEPIAEGLLESDDEGLFVRCDFVSRSDDFDRRVVGGRACRHKVYLHRHGSWVAPEGLSGSLLPWLPLSGPSPEDLNRLMASRDNRQHFMSFMRLFRTLKSRLVECAESDAQLMAQVRSELERANLCEPGSDIPERAVRGWRSGLRDPLAQVDPDLESIRSIAWALTNNGRIDRSDYEALAAGVQAKPLRAVIDPSGVVSLLVSDPAADHRLSPHQEVLSYPVVRGRSGLRLGKPSAVVLWAGQGRGSTLAEWPASQDWVQTGPVLLKGRMKRRAIEDVDRRFEMGRAAFFGPLLPADQEAYIRQFDDLSHRMNRDRFGLEVRRPFLELPIGFIASTLFNKKGISVVSLTTSAKSLAGLMDDEHYPLFREAYGRQLTRPTEAMEKLDRVRGVRPEVYLRQTPIGEWVNGREVLVEELQGSLLSLYVEEKDSEFAESARNDSSWAPLLLSEWNQHGEGRRVGIGGWSVKLREALWAQPIEQGLADGKSLLGCLLPETGAGHMDVEVEGPTQNPTDPDADSGAFKEP